MEESLPEFIMVDSLFDPWRHGISVQTASVVLTLLLFHKPINSKQGLILHLTLE